MNHARMHLIVVAAIALAALPASLGTATAATLCKSAVVTGIATGTQDLAISAWSQQASRTDGSVWSNFSLAKDKTYSEQNLGLATMFTVSAYPCRVLVLPVTGVKRFVKKP